MIRAHAAMWLLILSGCARDFAWETVITSTEGGAWRYQWRDDGVLWGFGAGAVRRDGRDWSLYSVCPDAQSVARGAFEPDGTMWVLCDTGLGQLAIRYEGEGPGADGVSIDLPLDGTVRLVPLDDEVLVIGATRLWAFDGTTWEAIAEHTLGEDLVDIGGSSRSAIYATRQRDHSLGTFVASNIEPWFYDGAAWAPLVLPGFALPTDPSTALPVAFLELAWFPRDDAWFMGPWRLDGADATLDGDWLVPQVRAGWFTEAHELVFSMSDGRTDTDTHDDLLWVVGPDDVRPDAFLGTGPWAQDPLYRNCSFRAGVVFALSRTSLLAEVCAQDGSVVELMEGRR